MRKDLGRKTSAYQLPHFIVAAYDKDGKQVANAFSDGKEIV